MSPPDPTPAGASAPVPARDSASAFLPTCFQLECWPDNWSDLEVGRDSRIDLARGISSGFVVATSVHPDRRSCSMAGLEHRLRTRQWRSPPSKSMLAAPPGSGRVMTDVHVAEFPSSSVTVSRVGYEPFAE